MFASSLLFKATTLAMVKDTSFKTKVQYAFTSLIFFFRPCRLYLLSLIELEHKKKTKNTKHITKIPKKAPAYTFQ